MRTLMALVLIAAAGMVALRNANAMWAGMIFLAAAAGVGVAVMGALILRGRERCWWAGFAFFSGGYLALAFFPYLTETVQPKLGTAHVIRKIYEWRWQSPFLPKAKVVEIDVHGHATERWFTPTKPSYVHFQRVGHSLFAVLAGLLGAMVGTWFHERRKRDEADTQGKREEGA